MHQAVALKRRTNDAAEGRSRRRRAKDVRGRLRRKVGGSFLRFLGFSMVFCWRLVEGSWTFWVLKKVLLSVDVPRMTRLPLGIYCTFKCYCFSWGGSWALGL